MQERIRQIMKREKLTAAQFADAIGVQRSSISHILSGRNKPGFDFINKILINFPSIDGNWLITGIEKQVVEPGENPTLFRQDDKKQSDQETPSGEELKENSEETENLQTTDKQGNSESGRVIEKIMIFYSDKSFREYLPERS